MELPAFFIADIPVYGEMILAPMDGISDPPFRALTRRLGSAISVSEFINCIEFLTHKDKHAQRFTFKPFEHPIGIQLLDNDPMRMAEAARRLDDHVNPDFFDINLGCPIRRITSRGAGAGLMRTPLLIKQIFSELSRATTKPLTAKLRMGWDEEDLNYLEIGKLLEESGSKMVVLHGRTTKMAYNGTARWQPIAELKTALSIPVVGNGDILTPQDAHRMRTETGCDAVMIGRGALANPWIFAGRDRADVPPSEVHSLMLSLLDAMLESYPIGALQAFRKFIKPLLAPYTLSREIMQSLLTCQDETIFKQRLSGVFTRIFDQN